MAKTLVEKARKERDTRLKTAASEADAEIAQYRASKEEEYQAQVKKYVGSTGETSEQIAASAQKNIRSTTAAAKSNKASVVDMLISYVRNV